MKEFVSTRSVDEVRCARKNIRHRGSHLSPFLRFPQAARERRRTSKTKNRSLGRKDAAETFSSPAEASPAAGGLPGAQTSDLKKSGEQSTRTRCTPRSDLRLFETSLGKKRDEDGEDEGDGDRTREQNRNYGRKHQTGDATTCIRLNKGDRPGRNKRRQENETNKI